jgi:hypothetical protein
MTTKAITTHDGGNHALDVKDASGALVATLNKVGDSCEVCIHSGSNETFTVREGAYSGQTGE